MDLPRPPSVHDVWRIRGEVQLPATYSQVRLHVTAVCKTVASIRPATAGAPGQSHSFRAGVDSCALEWLIWAPYVTLAPDSPRAPIRQGEWLNAWSLAMGLASDTAQPRRIGVLASRVVLRAGVGCSSACSRDAVDRRRHLRRGETPWRMEQRTRWTRWT